MDIPKRDKQYLGPAEPCEKRNLKKIHLQAELGHHEVQYPGGGERGHLLGPGGRGCTETKIFFIVPDLTNPISYDPKVWSTISQFSYRLC